MRSRKGWGRLPPDPQSQRFPEWKADGQHAGSGSVSLTGLVEDWWREASAAGHSESTYVSYKKAFATLAAFLKHDDASCATESDVLRFKDHLLTATSAKGKRLSTTTVKLSLGTAQRVLLGGRQPQT